MTKRFKIVSVKKWAAKKDKWFAKGRNDFRKDLLFEIRLAICDADSDVEFWREVGYFIDTFGIAVRSDLIAEHRAKSGWWSNE